MAYADIYNTAHDAAIFQPRCYVAMWYLARDVSGNPAATEAQKEWAKRVLGQGENITALQLAWQVLHDNNIATKLGSATDQELQNGVSGQLAALVAIG